VVLGHADHVGSHRPDPVDFRVRHRERLGRGHHPDFEEGQDRDSSAQRQVRLRRFSLPLGRRERERDRRAEESRGAEGLQEPQADGVGEEAFRRLNLSRRFYHFLKCIFFSQVFIRNCRCFVLFH
jgi:hypothetical protein